MGRNSQQHLWVETCRKIWISIEEDDKPRSCIKQLAQEDCATIKIQKALQSANKAIKLQYFNFGFYNWKRQFMVTTYSLIYTTNLKHC
jgi:hypothetical protein